MYDVKYHVKELVECYIYGIISIIKSRHIRNHISHIEIIRLGKINLVKKYVFDKNGCS